MLQIIADKHN